MSDAPEGMRMADTSWAVNAFTDTATAQVRQLRTEITSLQAENERLRAALQRIADCKEPEFDGHNTATILSGIAWAALAPPPQRQP